MTQLNPMEGADEISPRTADSFLKVRILFSLIGFAFHVLLAIFIATQGPDQF